MQTGSLMKLELVIYPTSKFVPSKDKLLFCLPQELDTSPGATGWDFGKRGCSIYLAA